MFVAARDHWIVKTLSDLQVKIDNLTDMIHRITNEHVTTLSLPDNVILPVDNVNDLKDLEETLKDETVRDRLVSLSENLCFCSLWVFINVAMQINVSC